MCAQGSLDEGGGQQALILRLTAILPYNNLERAQAFFERLGFSREESLDEAPSHLQTQARLCCGLAGVSLRCRCPDLGAGVADRSVAGGVTTGGSALKIREITARGRPQSNCDIFPIASLNVVGFYF